MKTTTFAYALALTSAVAGAQEIVEPQPPPAPAPARVRAPVTMLVANPDAVRFGIQFHGEVTGGTSGFGGAVSLGIGFNRVAILFTPAISAVDNVAAVSLDLAVRIYLHARQAGVLVGYLRPGFGVGTAGMNALVQANFGAGVEYVLTRNLGLTAELGLRVAGGANTRAQLHTIGAVGVMLHQ
jgi:hypothetical protein